MIEKQTQAETASCWDVQRHSGRPGAPVRWLYSGPDGVRATKIYEAAARPLRRGWTRLYIDNILAAESVGA